MKNKSISNYFVGRLVVLVCSLLAVFSAIFENYSLQGEQTMEMNSLISFGESWPYFLKLGLSLFGLGLLFYLSRSLISKYRFHGGNRIWMFAFTALFIALFPLVFSFPILILTVCLSNLMLAYFLQIHQQMNIQIIVFVCSLIAALASLFYLPVAVFLLIIWIGLAIIRPFNIKDYLVSAIGFCVPFFYLFTIEYLKTGEVSMDFLNGILAPPILLSRMDKWNLGLMGFYLLLAAINHFKIKTKLTVHQRNQHFMLILMSIAVIVMGIAFNQYLFLLFLLTPALVSLLEYHQTMQKRIFFELVLLMHLLLVSVYYFSN